MHYRGAVISSIWRVVGVVLACLYILVVQLIIYDFSNHMILMMPLIGLGLAFSARLHVMEKVGAGVGFASIYHRHYVRPESASVSGSGVQRSGRITSVTVSLVVTPDFGFSHAPPAELFRGDAFVVSDYTGGKVARQRHASPFLIQRRRLFRDDQPRASASVPSSRMRSPAAAQLAGYIFDLEGYSRRLHGFAHRTPHRGVK